VLVGAVIAFVVSVVSSATLGIALGLAAAALIAGQALRARR
jgi:hypothetical protein